MDESGFADVEDGVYYTAAVNWCAENSIMGGYGGSDRFGVGEPATREETATILYRAYGEQGDGVIGGDFPDKGEVSEWAVSPMAWALSYGLVNGSDGMLLPKAWTTRAQLAQIWLNAYRAGL